MFIEAMRLSAFSFFAFLSLQTMFVKCHAKEDEDRLESFIKKLQTTTLSFELWYSNYSAHKSFIPQGNVHDQNKNLYLFDAALQISNWTSAANGGGIATNICSLDNMRSPIFLKNNYTQNSGGGIYAHTRCIIQNNKQPICFDRNICKQFGGAISSQSINIENNLAGIYFLGNSVANQNGGALDGKNITIKNCGPILFFNNSAVSTGGAVLCENRDSQTIQTKCEISADYGNIVFYDNILTNLDQKNALQSNRNSALLLGAKKYYSIKFFDPVLFHSTDAAVFNAEQDQQGTILFSSKYIVQNEATIKNRFSYFRNSCTLANGIVHVTDGAGLACYKFQQDNGILCLGNGATLTTEKRQINHNTANSTQNCQLNVTKLAIDLPSIRKHDSTSPVIWIYPNETNGSYSEDTNPTINVSGDLIFLDEDGNDPYDSLDLSRPVLEVPLLRFWDNATNKINLNNFNPEGANSQKHYGHQGAWKFYWVNQATATNSSSAFTANSSRKILYGDWTPTVYIPNPQHMTPLVANAIWESVYTLIPGMQLGAMFDDHTPSYIDGQVTGMVHVQNSRKNTPGFHMRTKSYWTGGKYAKLQSQKLYLHFGQSFSHIKEKRTKNKLDSKNYGVTFKINSSIKDDFLYLSASCGYAYGTHKVKHFYPDPTRPFSTGEFFSTTLSVFAHLLKPLTFSLFDKHVASFVEAHLFQSFLSSFKEEGAFPRSFKTNRPFYDLSIPVGILITSKEGALGCPNWTCRLAYQPTVYRESPSILTTLIASNGSWVSSGTKVSRHTLNVQLNSEVEFLSRLLIRCTYEGSFSMTTVCNYATLKGILKF